MNKKRTVNKKTIAGCLALAAILSSGVLPVYATEAINKNTSLVCLEKDNSNILVDANIKEFDNLNKVHKYLNFDYKVPDYIKNDYFTTLIRIQNYTDDNKILELRFSNKAKYDIHQYYNDSYTLYEFKGNPIQCLKDIKYGMTKMI